SSVTVGLNLNFDKVGCNFCVVKHCDPTPILEYRSSALDF
ncbi:hypothetical protein L914_10230, partial [Phytophthora nicotianae]